MYKIGFIGLGIMGMPMAKNLIDAGYELTAYDINKKALTEIVEYGAKKGVSIKDVVGNSELILTMLPNSPHVKEVVMGENGIINSINNKQVFIDMSSISPLVSQEIGLALEDKGVNSMDAPVSGGEEKAKEGTLAFMVGGKKEVFDKYRSILDIMGESVTLVGNIGAGQTTKLVNQAIVGINIAAISEALTLGKKSGVDPEKIFNAIRGGLAGSQCLEDKAPRMFSGNFDPGFKMKLHVKDLNNVFESSRELNVAMPLTSLVMDMMQSIMNDGHTEADHGGLALFYEKINKLSLKND